MATIDPTRAAPPRLSVVKIAPSGRRTVLERFGDLQEARDYAEFVALVYAMIGGEGRSFAVEILIASVEAVTDESAVTP